MNTVPTMLAFLGLPGGWEWLVLLLLGLLLFGRRLPEVGANVAKTIVGFKREINNVNTQVEEASRRPESSSSELPRDERSVSQEKDKNEGNPYAAPVAAEGNSQNS